MHEHRSSLAGIHGGYTAAIVVNAVTAAVNDPMGTLRNFATQFAAVPQPGAADIAHDPEQQEAHERLRVTNTKVGR